MKSRELVIKLQDRIVFSALDIERIIGKDRKYAYLTLQRLKRANLIYEVEKGRYSCQRDPFLVASRVVWPAYISGWAALQFHQLSEQLPNIIEVVTTRSKKKRKLTFMNIGLEFSRIKKSNFFGYDKIEYKKAQIFIADREKALLDTLFLRHMSPSEFIEILRQNKRAVNTRKLLLYAKKMGISTKIKKLVESHD